jgi:hypothetical protein
VCRDSDGVADHGCYAAAALYDTKAANWRSSALAVFRHGVPTPIGVATN